MKSALRFAALVACVVAPSACSSTPSEPAHIDADAGGTGDSGSGVDAGSTVDAGPVINSCTKYQDHTAAGDARVVAWDFPIAQSAERCLTVKVGQTVTWVSEAGFSTHPLKGGGGKTPNPIINVGADGKVTFTAEGTYGYNCDIHPAMLGAVRVVP